MQPSKIIKVGNSAGLILPKEALGRLNVDVGDAVFLIDSPDGLRITPYDPDFEEQMAVARRVMKRRRAALRELAH